MTVFGTAFGGCWPLQPISRLVSNRIFIGTDLREVRKSVKRSQPFSEPIALTHKFGALPPRVVLCFLELRPEVRGPDWQWGEEDGGKSGVILSFDKAKSTAQVLWEGGKAQNHYRYGRHQDLLIQAGSSLGRRNSQAFFSSKSQTLLIFDWDDTLFPTTYVRDDLDLAWNRPLKDQDLTWAEKNEIGKKLEQCASHVPYLHSSPELVPFLLGGGCFPLFSTNQAKQKHICFCWGPNSSQALWSQSTFAALDVPSTIWAEGHAMSSPVGGGGSPHGLGAAFPSLAGCSMCLTSEQSGEEVQICCISLWRFAGRRHPSIPGT